MPHRLVAPIDGIVSRLQEENVFQQLGPATCPLESDFDVKFKRRTVAYRQLLRSYRVQKGGYLVEVGQQAAMVVNNERVIVMSIIRLNIIRQLPTLLQAKTPR
jgi:hypothetical protein